MKTLACNIIDKKYNAEKPTPKARVKTIKLHFINENVPLVANKKEVGTKLFVKNMVSIRCKMVVKSELEKHGLHYSKIDLAEVQLIETISEKQFTDLNIDLLKSGLELLQDNKAILISKIKSVIVEMVHYEEELPRIKNSDYISGKLHYDYTYLASLFSEATGITIEHYIISHKIERIKELLLYEELSLTEISYKLHYSSVAHLSNQFKKVTGLTPTFFSQLKNRKRTTLDNV